MSEPIPAATLYRRRIDDLSAKLADLSRRSATIGNLRGLAFLVALGCAIWGAAGSGGAISLGAGGAAIIAFVVLVRTHARLSEREDFTARLLNVNENALKRVNGSFRELADDGADILVQLGSEQKLLRGAATLSDDLDVFGRASLFQRISVARTSFGRKELGLLLLGRTEPQESEARQLAVRALAPELDLRHDVEALAAALERKKTSLTQAAALDPEPLLRWAESPARLSQRVALAWAARVCTAISVAALLAVWLHSVPAMWLLGPLTLNLVILIATREATRAAFQAVATREGMLSGYDRLFEAIEQSKANAPLLVTLRERLNRVGSPPSRAMAELRRSVSYFELRYNALLYPFANLFLLWDVHCTLAVERWQRKNGKQARDWFDVLGEFEALSSLAGLCFDEPEFCFPTFAADARFEAEGLAHPLLDAGKRVGNDVSLVGAGSALLITGSNMSGKSTLLRSIGVACVLAYAGAPVCARALRVGALELGTSLRIRDSLEEGVSHFYAELRKLRAVLDATGGERPVLFLLDEILHGTNSRERQIGARWILSELLQRGALGAVSTHDMALCELSSELMQHVTLVHLRESVQGEEMTFDYRLRPGPVKAGNALRLMRQIGLGVPLDSGTEP